MKYEWRVVEHWFSQGYGSVNIEKERMLSDGFEYVTTFSEDKIHSNIYRKKIKDEKVWLDFLITPNLSIKDKEGNIFTIVQLQSQLREFKGWLILSPTDGVVYKPNNSYYFSACELAVYLNENEFLLA